MIAAPRSGSGKTMVTCGILELLKRKQKNPFSYKCGPDYIDGLFHRKVLGIEGGNLDSFFEQPQDMREKYAAVSETHFPVVEGVMGYFDGLGGDTTAASSWEVADILDLPVVLVVDATFNYFNEFGLNEYVNFLRDTKDMRNSTIGKQMGFLKWFLRWSFKKGHHQNIAYDTFKPKLKTTSKKVIFLTWDELNKLKDYQIPKDKQYLERVRDVFLFCCFTSLRYSDVRNLKRSDVKSDHIEITTVKTADSLTIELNKYSKAILDKYKDIHFENYMALPVISNQKMNDYLKELGELAEINEPVRETYYKGNERIDEVTPKYALLSTHAGRRTFICNALALGIPAQVVMKWTGHSDYKAMKPYIDIADDIKANAMNKFNQL